MPIYLKRSLLTLSIATAILVITHLCFYMLVIRYVATNDLRSMIISAAQKKFKRKITADEKVQFKMDLDFRPHVIFTNLTIENAEWGTQDHILTVARIDVKLDLWALYHHELEIMKVTLEDAILNIETSDAQKNWDFANNITLESNFTDLDLEIQEILIKHSTLNYYKDRKLSNQLLISELSVLAEFYEQEFAVTLNGVFNQLPIKTKLFATFADDRLTAEIYYLLSGASDLKGKLIIDYANELSIESDLYSKRLVIADMLPRFNLNTYGKYTIPNTSLPIAKLKKSQLGIKIKADELVIYKAVLNGVNIKVNNQDQVVTLAFDPPTKIANGELKTIITYNLNEPIPKMKLKLHTKNLSIPKLITAATGGRSPVSDSTLAADVDLTGHGNNFKDIVASMYGKILATTTAGAYQVNPDKDDILNSLLTFENDDPEVKVDCLVMNLNVKRGIATSRNGLGFEAETVNVQGNGTINFNNGLVDFSISHYPTISRPMSLSQLSLAQAVLISGTIANPEVKVNYSGILSNNADFIGGGLISSIAGLGLAGITGGMFAVASIFFDTRDVEKITPCKTALEQ